MKTPLSLLLLPLVGTLFAQLTAIPREPITFSSTITGNPYSAQAATETVQTLPDGNRIVQKTSSPVYRDTQGRQRREVLTPGRPRSVSSIVIADPVAGVNWTLNPSTRVAFRIERPKAPDQGPVPTSPTGGSIGVRVIPDSGADHGAVIGDVMPESPAAAAGLQRGDVVIAVNGQPIKSPADLITRINGIAPGTSIQVTIERQGKSSAVKMTTRPRFETFVPSPFAALQYRITPDEQATLQAGLTPEQSQHSRIEDLGTMNIAGLQARGTRTTVTYAAGQVGNERPFTVVNEVWYSPDLQAILVSKHNDPRSGEVTYSLTDIKRSEPPSSVFEVPGDYKILRANIP